MKTKTASARILSALSLLLCFAIFLIFPLSACGDDNPHVPADESREWGEPSDAWGAQSDDAWGAETTTQSDDAWGAETPTQSDDAWGAQSDDAWGGDHSTDSTETTARQPSNKLLTTEDETTNKFSVSSQWFFVIAALWIVYDIHFKRALLRNSVERKSERKKTKAEIPKSVESNQNALPSHGQFKELEQDQRLDAFESRIAKLELAEQRRNENAPDKLPPADAAKSSAILIGVRLTPQNPEELENKNYEDPNVRLTTAPQGNLEIIGQDPNSDDVFAIPVLNEKTSDNPPGGVISRKSLCYSVIRSCFRLSRFPSDGLDRANVTISKPAQLQRHKGYYTVKAKGEIVIQ